MNSAERLSLRYLFDPVCGWCYGAAPVLRRLADLPGLEIVALPTGLFSGDGVRQMEPRFAEFAWSNDQRIERLTGQPFSAAYRRNVLGAVGHRVDSGPATLALTAIARTAPDRAMAALSAIQSARYRDGRDITDLRELAAILRENQWPDAAEAIALPDASLMSANETLVADGQRLMAQVGANGVPALVVMERENPQSPARLIPSTFLFGPFDALVTMLHA